MTRRVLSTRRTAEGHIRRRCELSNGARFTTIEIPVSLWKRISLSNKARDDVRDAALLALRHGDSVAKVAKAYCISESTVRRWKALRKV